MWCRSNFTLRSIANPVRQIMFIVVGSHILYGALGYKTFVCRITCTIGSCHTTIPVQGIAYQRWASLLNIRHTNDHQRFRESEDNCNT